MLAAQVFGKLIGWCGQMREVSTYLHAQHVTVLLKVCDGLVVCKSLEFTVVLHRAHTADGCLHELHGIVALLAHLQILLLDQLDRVVSAKDASGHAHT